MKPPLRPGWRQVQTDVYVYTQSMKLEQSYIGIQRDGFNIQTRKNMMNCGEMNECW